MSIPRLALLSALLVIPMSANEANATPAPYDPTIYYNHTPSPAQVAEATALMREWWASQSATFNWAAWGAGTYRMTLSNLQKAALSMRVIRWAWGPMSNGTMTIWQAQRALEMAWQTVYIEAFGAWQPLARYQAVRGVGTAIYEGTNSVRLAVAAGGTLATALNGLGSILLGLIHISTGNDPYVFPCESDPDARFDVCPRVSNEEWLDIETIIMESPDVQAPDIGADMFEWDMQQGVYGGESWYDPAYDPSSSYYEGYDPVGPDGGIDWWGDWSWPSGGGSNNSNGGGSTEGSNADQPANIKYDSTKSEGGTWQASPNSCILGTPDAGELHDLPEPADSDRDGIPDYDDPDPNDKNVPFKGGSPTSVAAVYDNWHYIGEGFYNVQCPVFIPETMITPFLIEVDGMLVQAVLGNDAILALPAHSADPEATHLTADRAFLISMRPQ